MSGLMRMPALLAVLLAGVAVPGWARAIEKPFVRDEARFFSPDAVKKAEEKIEAIKRDYGKDLLIETYPEIPTRIKEKHGAQSREKLFDAWSRERMKAEKINGLYLVITRNPGFAWLEIDNATAKRAFTTSNRDDLIKQLLERFREKQFDEGLLGAVDYVAGRLDFNIGKQKASAVSGMGSRAQEGTTSRKAESHATGLIGMLGGWLCLGLVALLGVWLVVGLIRAFSGPRYTPDRPGYGGGPGGPGGYPGGYGGYGGGYAPGGGGFMSSLLGGMFGAAAGHWIYDSMFRGSTPSTPMGGPANASPGPEGSVEPGATGAGGAFDTGADQGGGGYFDDQGPSGAGGSFDNGYGGGAFDDGGYDSGGGGFDSGYDGGYDGGGGSFGDE